MPDQYAELVFDLVSSIPPGDDQEAQDRRATLAWITSGAPLCRTARPATPPEHLVSYAVAVDRSSGEVLLVDHRLSGLWLPPGGHVDHGEHPAAAARRELREELGVVARHVDGVAEPLMVTRTTTVGRTAGHTDVSLWYCFEVHRHQEVDYDTREFVGIRWWKFSEIAHRPSTRFDPNLPRFVAKLVDPVA